MKTLCEINQLIETGALNKNIVDIPAHGDMKQLVAGVYKGIGALHAPDSTSMFIYHVYEHGAGNKFIEAHNSATGQTSVITQTGGQWSTWQNSVSSSDLSKYLTATDITAFQSSHQVDVRADNRIHDNSNMATTTRNGTIKVKLSGSHLYMTNNGHNP